MPTKKYPLKVRKSQLDIHEIEDQADANRFDLLLKNERDKYNSKLIAVIGFCITLLVGSGAIVNNHIKKLQEQEQAEERERLQRERERERQQQCNERPWLCTNRNL